MTTPLSFADALAACPLVAILRGLTPDEAPAVGAALVDAGFTLVEVPLNSPHPFESIRILADQLAGRAVVGAGTVLTTQDVAEVKAAGGALAVSPDSCVEVIAASRAAGLTSIPGFATPSEAFAALRAGADALKLFPAEAASPAALKAMRAVLPATVPVLIVGGITPGGMAAWKTAGANGFGIGSSLYRAGKPAADVARDAAEFVTAWKELA